MPSSKWAFIYKCGSDHHAHIFNIMMSVMIREKDLSIETQKSYLFIESRFNKGWSWQNNKQLKHYCCNTKDSLNALERNYNFYSRGGL